MKGALRNGNFCINDSSAVSPYGKIEKMQKNLSEHVGFVYVLPQFPRYTFFFEKVVLYFFKNFKEIWNTFGEVTKNVERM